MDEAAKAVSFREESESIEVRVRMHSKSVSPALDHTNRSRRESNPHLRFRKPLFYPLNYGNRKIEK